jgi:hypothetical protein
LHFRRGFPDNPITTDGVAGFVNAKIEGSLAEARALLESGRPADAALVFERVLLVAPHDPVARAGLDEARRALAESERVLDQRRAESAREADPRVPAESRWFSWRAPALDAADAPAPPPRVSGRPRAVLGSACAVAFAALGIAVASNWDGLMRNLTKAPVPRDEGAAFSSLPAARAEDQTIAAARRLIDDGDPARAVALLDSVSPDQPAYPFARQLRGHAERALREGVVRTGARRP